MTHKHFFNDYIDYILYDAIILAIDLKATPYLAALSYDCIMRCVCKNHRDTR